MQMVQVPIFYFVAALFVVLVAILVVQIKTLKVLRSFQQPPEEYHSDKEQLGSLTFKDMR